MRIAFFGTPDVAVPALQALIGAEDVEIVAVITNPDRPRGRSRRLIAPPVKSAALEAGLEVLQPDRPRDVVDTLQAMHLDAAAVVAYGALMPAEVLAAGGRGMVNLHFSLLPRWRGAAPVQHALRAGDARTGVTTFVLDEGMDTGPILAQHEVAVDPEEGAGTLLDRLAVLGAPILVDSLRALVAGSEPRPQPTDGVTLAPKISPSDVAIDFTADARRIVNLVRSADPAPGAHTRFRGKRLKIYQARALDPTTAAKDIAAAAPGTIVTADPDGVDVRCGDGVVRLEALQPEGKARMDTAAFVNGYRPEPGERLGPDA